MEHVFIHVEVTASKNYGSWTNALEIPHNTVPLALDKGASDPM